MNEKSHRMIEEKIQTFLGYCILNYRGTKFEFHPVDKLRDEVGEYTGEADTDRISIATGGDTTHWLQVFVHETCHLDQAKENLEWFQGVDKYITAFNNWLEGKEPNEPNENNELVTWDLVSKIVELEHDCEKRSLQKIKDFGLPINLEEYAQKANAYLISYITTLKNREWGALPYTKPEIWSKMPKELMTMEDIHNEAKETLRKKPSIVIKNENSPISIEL